MAMTRISAALAELGWGKSRGYDLIRQGLLPRPVKVGSRAAAIPSHEIQAVNAARAAGRTDDEIRALVIKLETARRCAT